MDFLKQIFTIATVLFGGLTQAQEPLYSGPQIGEKLNSFKVRGAFDQDAGVEMDFVEKANGKPIVLIFVHDLNRQSISMTRVLSNYTYGRAKDGLSTGVVWLSDDPAEAESTLKRVRHALAKGVPTGISMDGREGPGSYGLNRKVTLTILVGNQGKVTGNFALVQPSLQVDLPKILESVTAVVGGTVPKLEELEGMPEMMAQRGSPEQAPNLRPWLAPVIRIDAQPGDVDKAAEALIEFVEKDESAKKELGRIASTIVKSGKLDNYGTPRAREYLTQWANTYGEKTEDAKSDRRRSDERK